mmetsp:Transcript_100411/g.284257  ORF Transcript_100411/g.284257 Transcript_100411/m.284257 type:complete len:202 (+) Transcript_100411:589-1194(+)
MQDRLRTVKRCTFVLNITVFANLICVVSHWILRASAAALSISGTSRAVPGTSENLGSAPPAPSSSSFTWNVLQARGTMWASSFSVGLKVRAIGCRAPARTMPAVGCALSSASSLSISSSRAAYSEVILELSIMASRRILLDSLVFLISESTTAWSRRRRVTTPSQACFFMTASISSTASADPALAPVATPSSASARGASPS